MIKTLIILSLGIFTIGCRPNDANKQLFETEAVNFVIDTITTEVRIPWGLDWLPDGKAIFTERGKPENTISLLDPGTGKITPVCDVPKVHRKGDGGMLDIIVHPEYQTKPFIYFAYSLMKADSTSTLVVDRAKLSDNCLKERQRLFEVLPYFKSNGHYGCRMQIQNGYLFISMGERYDAKDSAQTLTNHFGKVMRLHDDGRVPDDNPFVRIAEALPEIWSYGHRNPQGMIIHPRTGELWVNEHGPQGGDEINIVRAGLNYGWPVITYGEEYGGGPIGEGITEKEGMEQPLYQYTPSIAPSDMICYSGKAFPEWKDNLFIGALALQHLNRVILDGGQIREERILQGQNWRVRMVSQGPDGFIYLGVDTGMILRLRPTSH